jgi:hypothetical protein
MDNEKEEPTFDLDRVLCPSCLNCAGPLAVLSTYAGLCASVFGGRKMLGRGGSRACAFSSLVHRKLRGVAKSLMVTGFGLQTNLLEVAISKRPLALIHAYHVQRGDGEGQTSSDRCVHF